jgi:glycosyltransferase involved in cell wall biosynthesis
MQAKVSWLAPVYNKVAWIAETIKSMQNQTLKDIEIIFVDDGSTDGTDELIEHFMKEDDRIRLHRMGKNFGLGVAWNTGTKLVRSDIICVGSGDDIWTPNRSMLTYSALINNKKDVFYGAFWFCDYMMNKTEYKPTVPYDKRKLLTPRKDGYCPQYIGHFVMGYTTKIAKKVPYRSNLKVGIDYPFLVDLAKKNARFCWTNKELGYARLLSTGVSLSRRGEVNEASRI